jgi:hypothetical protein
MLPGVRNQSGIRTAEGMRLWEGTLLKTPYVRGNTARAPSLHCTLALTLQPGNNHGKTSVRVAEKCLAEQCCARFLLSTWPPRLACWLQPPLACVCFRRLGSVPIQSKYRPSCRTTGFPASASLQSRNYQSGLWSGRRKMELPNPRKFSCC